MSSKQFAAAIGLAITMLVFSGFTPDLVAQESRGEVVVTSTTMYMGSTTNNAFVGQKDVVIGVLYIEDTAVNGTGSNSFIDRVWIRRESGDASEDCFTNWRFVQDIDGLNFSPNGVFDGPDDLFLANGTGKIDSSFDGGQAGVFFENPRLGDFTPGFHKRPAVIVNDGAANILFIVADISSSCEGGTLELNYQLDFSHLPLSDKLNSITKSQLACQTPPTGMSMFPSAVGTSLGSNIAAHTGCSMPKRNGVGVSISTGSPPTETPPPSETPPPTRTIPPAGGSSLADFDTNDNCSIDDPEFFNAVDSWLSESISDALFFDVLDAWIGQTDVCASAASLKISAQQTASGGFKFSAQNASTTALHIEIYNLQGNLMHQQSASSGQLIWNLRSANGKFIANGVYLYKISGQDSSGKVVGREVRKLVILR